MFPAPPFPRDAQTLPAAACCALCASELFDDDPLYWIGGTILCTDCLAAFAEDYFAPNKLLGRQLLEHDEPKERLR